VIVKCLPHHDEEEERKKKQGESLDPAGHNSFHPFPLASISILNSYGIILYLSRKFPARSRGS
jgi:hypothetical protein